MKVCLYLLSALLFFIFSYPTILLAAVDPIPGLTVLTNDIVDTSMWAVSTLLVLLIIWLGVQFLINIDNPMGRSQVRTRAICAFIGLFIILSSRSLATWISALLPR